MTQERNLKACLNGKSFASRSYLTNRRVENQIRERNKVQMKKLCF